MQYTVSRCADAQSVSSLVRSLAPFRPVRNADMDGATAPNVSPFQVLDGRRAAHAYCRAIEVLRGGLERSERAALQWCLHADGAFAAMWEAQRDEASDLLPRSQYTLCRPGGAGDARRPRRSAEPPQHRRPHAPER